MITIQQLCNAISTQNKAMRNWKIDMLRALNFELTLPDKNGVSYMKEIVPDKWLRELSNNK